MTDLLPGQPAAAGEPVFREPWEAQAFAMAVRLHEQGLFTWPQWAAALAREIERARDAGDPDTGESYYHHWLAALERLVAETGAASTDEQEHGPEHRHRLDLGPPADSAGLRPRRESRRARGTRPTGNSQ